VLCRHRQQKEKRDPGPRFGSAASPLILDVLNVSGNHGRSTVARIRQILTRIRRNAGPHPRAGEHATPPTANLSSGLTDSVRKLLARPKLKQP